MHSTAAQLDTPSRFVCHPYDFRYLASVQADMLRLDQLEREREQQRLQQQVPLDDASRRRRPSCLACRRPLTLLRGRLKSSSGSCKRPQQRQRASKLKLLPLRQSSRRRLLPPQGLARSTLL